MNIRENIDPLIKINNIKYHIPLDLNTHINKINIAIFRLLSMEYFCLGSYVGLLHF